MIRSAIIIVLVNYGAFLFSQELHLSRNFVSPKKNLVVEIINSHPAYFYVIRQNKVVHDITIERRAKPSAEIIAFTPLKLDSVNATWFDYENLDYLAYEHNYKFYFLFEKVLNTKKTLYLKIIDTTGKATGFIELASLESDNATKEFGFTYRRSADNTILIIASKAATNGITRKQAFLFSPDKREMIWSRRLPLENNITVFSGGFACNDQHDLFYLQTRLSILGYETYTNDRGTYTVPVLYMDSLVLWEWKSGSEAPYVKRLHVQDIDDIRESFIVPEGQLAFVSLLGIKNDTVTGRTEELIVNLKLNCETGREIFNVRVPYDSLIRKQLTFYDGPEKESYYKYHILLSNYQSGRYLYTLSGRSEQDYFKELLFRKTDLKSGQIVSQKIIPRKLFFFRNRTRFKNIAEAMMYNREDSLKIFLLENPANFRRSVDNYDYRTFKKETNLSGANIVCYSLKPEGAFEKKLVFRNVNFDLVPLRYTSHEQSDMVFYLNNSKFEKFAILWLNP